MASGSLPFSGSSYDVSQLRNSIFSMLFLGARRASIAKKRGEFVAGPVMDPPRS